MTPVPILLYHAVTDTPSPTIAPFTVTPDQFRAHLDLLVDERFTVLSLSDYVEAREAGRTLPERTTVVTFDDGFADFADHAAPALRARGLPATLYVTTGMLRRDDADRARSPWGDRMLAWSDLPALEAAGIEIGGHADEHVALDTLPAARARADIERCTRRLEAALGHRVASFAYPHGYSGPRVRRMTRAAGYRSACGVRNALSPAGDDRYGIARLTVRDSTDLVRLHSWLYGAAPVAGSREAPATTAWRVYRRTRARVRWSG